jgi:hypothetical protein
MITDETSVVLKTSSIENIRVTVILTEMAETTAVLVTELKRLCLRHRYLWG